MANDGKSKDLTEFDEQEYSRFSESNMMRFTEFETLSVEEQKEVEKVLALAAD
jgi:hypothetical protein